MDFNIAGFVEKNFKIPCYHRYNRKFKEIFIPDKFFSLEFTKYIHLCILKAIRIFFVSTNHLNLFHFSEIISEYSCGLICIEYFNTLRIL